ncbi:acyl carrier protein, partial [Streptomyces sp.]|uniref:acyl carrier protein n=1 Tax=Streptomyces sp. TaxID=1931 RepID=UPI002F429EEC
MDAAPFPSSEGPDLTDPGFAELLLQERDTASRRDMLTEALLAFLVRTGALDADADSEAVALLDSLTAVELNAVLEARLGVDPGLSVLRHPASASELAETVAGLLDGAARPAGDGVLVPDPDSRFEPFPLTDLQQAYLLGRGGFFALGNVAAGFYAEID